MDFNNCRCFIYSIDGGSLPICEFLWKTSKIENIFLIDISKYKINLVSASS